MQISMQRKAMPKLVKNETWTCICSFDLIFFWFFEVPNFSSVFVTGINTNNLYLKVYSDALFSFYHHYDAFNINSFIKFIHFDDQQLINKYMKT